MLSVDDSEIASVRRSSLRLGADHARGRVKQKPGTVSSRAQGHVLRLRFSSEVLFLRQRTAGCIL